GVRTAWIKTAYALKARNLIKISKTSTFNAAAVLAAVDNSYTSNADDAGMASFSLRNPWAQVAVNNAANTLGGWLSEQFVDHLNGTTYGVFDPRIRKITDPTVVPAVPWIGTVNGAGNRPPGANTTRDENYISVNSPWTSATAPILLVTYAELKFIEAEAALVANPGRAYTAYLAGINANMDKLQVPTGAERTTYLTAAMVGSAALTRALIFKEKYVATYLNPEAWNDARRFDYAYKDFGLPVNAALPTFIRRLSYPPNERSENGENVPAASLLSEKLWWDR
ncbi:MAG TPA: SusD/RagB family nutrient-binding outer membrane lipoprotein, partial [Flavisolibacter sp.]|nr:SusD/RagB family nutrient-binding outer membrane lipoprotein [Flavisolibacter sp.]